MANIRLSAKQWAAIQAKYEAGESVKKLAEEYGIKPNTITQRAIRKGWKPRGSIKSEAIAEAQEEIKEAVKNDFKSTVERVNEEHSKFYKYPLKLAAIMMQAMDKRIAEAQARGENIKLGNDPYLLAQLASTMNMAITGIRTVNKYDAISPDKGDPNLERLYDSFAEQRKQRGIDESPPIIDESDEIEVPDVEVPDGI